MSGRREFLLAAGALGMAGAVPALAAEAPLETNRIRIARTTAICFAPIYVASEGLLQAEGFADVSYEQRGISECRHRGREIPGAAMRPSQHKRDRCVLGIGVEHRTQRRHGFSVIRAL